ncbi:MAG: acylneuraminate cytidylyltransferase family protein [Magnetococcales bacterium]|nr:acylneuraminate cytidylyltransferase family protein [Magnetococcales bacterium]
MSLKTLCVIPARGGSKSIPGKNLQTIGGRSLIARAVEVAQSCLVFDHIIVSTDDAKIANIVRSDYPEVDIPFLRDASLADDLTPLPAVSKHAFDFFAKQRFDAVFSLQPTNPFTSVETLRNSVELIKQKGVDSVVSISKILHQHPFRAYKWDSQQQLISPLTEYTKEIFPQKQDRPDAYGFTGALYGRRSHLFANWQNSGFVLGKKTAGVIVSEEEAMDIDTPFDLEICEALTLYRQSQNKTATQI